MNVAIVWSMGGRPERRTGRGRPSPGRASDCPAEYGDFVAQDQQFNVLGRRSATQQHQHTEQPTEDQVDEVQRHVYDHARPPVDTDHRKS
jgi:hypothetical protein